MISQKTLTYKKLTYSEVDNWNELLKNSDASFFQYPYFNEGYNHFPKSKAQYYVLFEQEKAIGFVSCIVVRIALVKIGLVLRGPVVLDKEKAQEVVQLVKQIQSKESFFFIRFNPNKTDERLNDLVVKDRSILKLDPFPMYRGSQGFDYIIHARSSEEELLASYKSRARQGIRYAGEEDFKFIRSIEDQDLVKVYDLFKKVAGKKDFAFRPLSSYRRILECGREHDLCTLYMASINDEVVNAAIIVKDGSSYNYLSGGLIDGTYRPRNSPSTLLHHGVMKDCFFSENKKWYNISHTSPSHPVYIFKSSFNPELIEYPGYYTITSYGLLVKVFHWLMVSVTKRLKFLIRRRIGNN